MQYSSVNKGSVGETISFVVSLILALLLLGITFHETLADLNTLWQFNNEAYSHGYLVLVLVLYVLYERRDLFVLNPTFTPLPLAFLTGLVWTAANTINVKLGEYLILPFVLYLFIVSSVGWRKSLYFILPISALYFALPIIGFINPLLQILTIKVVTTMVNMTDMVAHIDGFYITLPYGVLHVADSCSGLSYLSAGITFTMLYSFLNIRRRRLRILSIGLMLCLSLCANWLRVYILVIVGHESKMQSPLVKEHGFLGWIIFAAIFVFFLFVIDKLEKKFDKQETIKNIKRITRKKHSLNITQRNSYLHTALPLVLAIFTTATPLYFHFFEIKGDSFKKIDILLPSFSDDDEVISYKNQGTVSFPNADLALRVRGQRHDMVFTVFAIGYSSQKQGKEVIYYENKVGSNLQHKQRIFFNDLVVNYAYEAKTESHVYWYYKIEKDEVTSPIEAKLIQLKYLLKPSSALAIIIKVKHVEKLPSTVRREKVEDVINISREITLRLIE